MLSAYSAQNWKLIINFQFWAEYDMSIIKTGLKISTKFEKYEPVWKI